jgi:hypothetical protein
MTKKKKQAFACKGCRAAFSDAKHLFDTEEYVHDDGCIYATHQQREESFKKSVIEIIIADLETRGPVLEALRRCI